MQNVPISVFGDFDHATAMANARSTPSRAESELARSRELAALEQSRVAARPTMNAV
jgi:hypothetical protein